MLYTWGRDQKHTGREGRTDYAWMRLVVGHVSSSNREADVKRYAQPSGR